MKIGVSRIASALRNRAGFGEGTPQQDSMRAKWADGEIWTHGRILLYATQPFRFLRFCQSVKLALCRTFRFAVFPEGRSCPGVSPRRCFAHVIAKSYSIRTVIQFWGCIIVVTRFWQTKRANYTEHQKSAGAWLSLQNDVLCNRLWKSKSGSASYSSRQQNQRRSGAVRHFRCTDTVSDKTDLWWNIGIQLYHHYTDTSLIRQVSESLSPYSEFQRAVFNGIRKRSLYWLGHLGAIYQWVL